MAQNPSNASSLYRIDGVTSIPIRESDLTILLSIAENRGTTLEEVIMSAAMSGSDSANCKKNLHLAH